MNHPIACSLSISPVFMTVFFLLPFASGCADLLHDLQRGPSCTRNYVTRDKAETAHGSVELVEVTGNCTDTGVWRLHGPGNLRVYDIENRPKDVRVTRKEPYWLRLSASVGGERRAWDYVAAENRDGKIVGERCEVRVLDSEAPSLQACLGGSWASVARTLERPTAFDEEASALVAKASQAPGEAVLGLNYFQWTWDMRLGEGDDEVFRSEENKAAIRGLVRKAGCGPMVRATPQIWSDYLAALDVIMAGEADQLLAACDSWLVENLSEQHEKLAPRLETPEVVRAIDAALIATISESDPIDEQSLGVWLARLEHTPKPSEQLADAMDQSLLSALEDAAKEGPFAEQQRERLRRRLALAAEVQFSPATRERLNGLLLTYIDRLDDEAYLWLDHLRETPRLDGFVAAIDARIAAIFPRGSQFFLKRLDDPSLPRPNDAARDGIVARARKMQEEGRSIAPASCLVVRRLLLLESNDGQRECALPETF
jgi:hypothetical protein